MITAVVVWLLCDVRYLMYCLIILIDKLHKKNALTVIGEFNFLAYLTLFLPKSSL